MRYGDVHVQLVATGLAGLPPQEGADRRAHVKRVGLQRVRVVVEGLVLQVLPDGQIRDDGDAEIRQMRRRADAGAQQNRRARVRAGREDHLAGVNLGAACCDHADRAALVEQNAIDQHVA